MGGLDGDLPGRAGLVASGVRVVTVPDAGHNIMFDNPDAFVREVARFGRCAGAQPSRTATAR
ncbi:hypothetical protein GCM10010331_22120 [Streptomyces xanthochromogenes]|nr:hypothetical protein GCM10010331_22120 [Streptomyces xanthochromogenes]